MLTKTQTFSITAYTALMQAHFNTITKSSDKLFLTDASKDDLWNVYINSIPEEHRQKSNCNNCRVFIKNFGNVVIIDSNYEVRTIWDFEVPDTTYQTINLNLSQLVRSAAVSSVFIQGDNFVNKSFASKETKSKGLLTVGTPWNMDGPTIKWNHLYLEVPSKFIHNLQGETLDSVKARVNSSNQVWNRALEEITIDATEIVLGLINQNSLYRGLDYKGQLERLLTYQKAYSKLPDSNKVNYCWANTPPGAIAHIKNSAIGTLLINISSGVELDVAVSKFEAIMAPTNYKRPKAIITSNMVKAAEKTLTELGLESSLERRFATPDDVPVNSVLFVNRAKSKSSKSTSPLSVLSNSVKVTSKTLNKIEEVSLDKFISDILPTATSLKVLLQKQQAGNLVSLIAPVDKDASPILKWDNNFSWSYKNNLTDSIKEKVKNAGGNVTGKLRVSLVWYTTTDLDIHMQQVGGESVSYLNKIGRYATLDVDMNCGNTTTTPVENIVWANEIPESEFEIKVHNYTDRQPTDHFTVELEYEGVIQTFEFNQNIRYKEYVDVVKFKYSKSKGIEIISSINSKTAAAPSVELWGIDTNVFHNVSMVALSPNYWNTVDEDGNTEVIQAQQAGNKHLFFFLDRCKNNEPVRTFFNEFLKEELNRNHKRVFEALADKMKVEPDNEAPQLSGLGFSTTSKTSFYCEVEGSFKRQLKVII